MKYVSTRGEAPPIGFLDAVLSGLAPDGGLYVPQDWPSFTQDEIAAFAGRPYAQVAAAVLAKFAGDEIASDDLLAMCEAAYASFTHPATAPLKQLGDNLFLLELFHGPTLAFKDVAMQLLARLYDHVLAAEDRRMTIVCATSGDTGGAAVEAFAGARNVRIAAMFPNGRISEVQRRFMTTAADANVACLSVDGTFDDCQHILKALFADGQFVKVVDLSAVNSINWARVAAQSVYYFTAAVALGAPYREVAFVTPTGNFGDAYAGWAARRLGLPIKAITAATNENDIVARALTTGRYARGSVASTMSPAMDIQVASNFERLYFECAGRDGAATGRAFRAFAETGALDLPADVQARMNAVLTGVAVSEAATAQAMRDTLAATGEMVDPHTAVGLAAAGAARAKLDPAVPLVVLSTAHPAKFPEAVLAATGRTAPAPRGAEDLFDRPERIHSLPADVEAVKAYVRGFVQS